MPHPRKADEHILRRTSFDDWANQIDDLPEMPLEEMTLKELLKLKDSYQKRIDKINALIKLKVREGNHRAKRVFTL